MYLQMLHSEKVFIIFSIYTVVEFSFFCLFYYYILTNATSKKFVFPIWLGFIIIAGIDFFFINGMSGFDSFTSGLDALLIIGMCIYYLFMQIKGSISLRIYSTSNFWVIITFLLYVSGTFFLYIMAENMLDDRSFVIQYTYINSAFNIIKNVLLSIAMLMTVDEVQPERKRNYEWDNYNPLN